MHRVRLSAFIYKGELFGFRSEKLSFYRNFIAVFFLEKRRFLFPHMDTLREGKENGFFIGTNGEAEGNEANERGI